METMAQIIVELLKVEYLETTSLLVIERHRVAHTSDFRRVVCAKALIIGGRE
jgi:hypothetical protein